MTVCLDIYLVFLKYIQDSSISTENKLKHAVKFINGVIRLILFPGRLAYKIFKLVFPSYKKIVNGPKKAVLITLPEQVPQEPFYLNPDDIIHLQITHSDDEDYEDDKSASSDNGNSANHIKSGTEMNYKTSNEEASEGNVNQEESKKELTKEGWSVDKKDSQKNNERNPVNDKNNCGISDENYDSNTENGNDAKHDV